MAKPLVSVILPVYNAAPTLSRAIKSILNQTFQGFELVVIDDGSTDQSLEIIQSFQSPRLKVVQQKHQGIVMALNRGIQLAQGQYIARMDADDVSQVNRLEKQADFLDKHKPIGLVSCLVRYCGDATRHQGYALHVEWLNQLTAPEQIYLRRFQDSPVAHPSVMFRKSLLAEYGGYRYGPFPEDYELWLRWMNCGVKMAKVPEFLLDWYDSPHRLSRNHDHYSEDAFYRLKAQYFTHWFLNTYNDSLPEIAIWGHGSAVKRKSRFLKQCGLTISAYIDVKPNTMQNEVIHYEEVKRLKNTMILSYVSDRQGRHQIWEYLVSCGFREGSNFYMMA